MMLDEELETRAGVYPDSPKADTDETQQFNMLVSCLMNIYSAKAVHYGSYIKTHGDDSPQLFAVEHFCDIKRKYVRAKTFIERMTRGELVDFTDLLDTYSDLAVYAVMGLQMVFHCREKMQGAQDEPYAGLSRVAPASPQSICAHVFVKATNFDTPAACVICGIELEEKGKEGPIAVPGECVHDYGSSGNCIFCGYDPKDDIPF